MKRQVTACDVCPNADVPEGHVVLTFSGERSGLVTSRIDGARKTLDICDACAVALGKWLAGRHPEHEAPSTAAAPPAPVAAPTVQPKPADAAASH